MDLMAGVPDLTSHPQQLPQGSLLESYTWRTGHRKAPVPDVATTTTALGNAIGSLPTKDSIHMDSRPEIEGP